jgi:hypothetical protein
VPLVTAGYSGTPLARKLGIKAGARVFTVGAPDALGGLLAPLPPGVILEPLAGPMRGGGEDLGAAAVQLAPGASAGTGLVLLFTTERAVLEAALAPVAEAIFPDGAWWVAWPKRASKVPTDVTEDVVREVVLPHGLVDVKVCAIDATWSGLKVCHRRENRSGSGGPQRER